MSQPKQKTANTSVPALCQTCKHWKNEQSELQYNIHYGICTCYKWKFGTANYGDCCVLDRTYRSEKYMGIQRFENQSKEVPINGVTPSRYCFVTEETFGCIHHNK